MQATDRDRRKGNARFVPPPPPAPLKPPPLPARAAQKAPVDPADQQWLEEAILRVIEKRADRVLSAPLPVVKEAPPAKAPSKKLRWAMRFAFVGALAAGYFALHHRYPVQTNTAIASTKSAAVHAWRWAVPEEHRIVVAPATTVESAPMAAAALPPTNAVGSAPASASAPATASAPAFATASAPASAAAPPAAPASAPVAAPEPEVASAKPEKRHHRGAKTAREHKEAAAAPIAAAPAPAPAAAPPPASPALRGSLGDAIKAASGGGAPAPAVERAPAEAKSESALPDRPAASIVKSAITAVLPDARACMNPGDEPAHAVVVFSSIGNVSAVQVSGGPAACIQKALARAHVPPFSQASYSAGVPVRAN